MSYYHSYTRRSGSAGRRFTAWNRKPREKYSVEQSVFNTTLLGDGTAAATMNITVVPASDVQGMRKIKHLTVSIAQTGSTSQPVYWALVYVPQGFGVPAGSSSQTGTNLVLNTAQGTPGTPTSMFEPNQYVMAQGVANLQNSSVRLSTPLARNLNSGDRIVLLMIDPLITSSSVGLGVIGTVKYAVALG